jgi:hypothetical protein
VAQCGVHRRVKIRQKQLKSIKEYFLKNQYVASSHCLQIFTGDRGSKAGILSLPNLFDLRALIFRLTKSCSFGVKWLRKLGERGTTKLDWQKSI